MFVTRFAPSPTGHLHLGHLLAALVAREFGQCRMRIEDIDVGRCRAHYVNDLREDLEEFGIEFFGEWMIQSERFDFYQEKLEYLRKLGVLYPCFCTRKQLLELSAPQGSQVGKYNGKCRNFPFSEVQARITAGEAHSWRLDMAKVAKLTGLLEWEDLRFGKFRFSPENLDDVILARKDCPVSYHLAVTLDDAAQGVTLVTRGKDLLEVTPVHRTLQVLFDLPQCQWFHHELVTDPLGKRLAKRDQSTSLRQLRASGLSVEEIYLKLKQFWPSELVFPF